MKWALLVLGFALGCAGGGLNIEDGGLVGEDGWPVRGASEQRRCPKDTDLIDEKLPDGRRTITCKSKSSPVARGFEISWYPNGTLATEAALDDQGRPQWRKTWHTNGELESEDTYTDNQLQRRNAFYSNGDQREIMERTPTGSLIKRFRIGGGIEAAGEYLGEHRTGTWQEWVDGAQETTEYVDGKKQGAVTRRYSDGSAETGFYEDGARDLRWERVGKNGIPILQQTYKQGLLQGPVTAYFPTGQPREISNYQAGRLHGPYKRFFPMGELELKGAYQCGKKHGDWSRYHEDGSIKSKGTMVAGQKSGEWVHYFASGDVAQVENHDVVIADPCAKP